MVGLTSLWLPIVLSAVLVFLVSSILHMVLPLHRSDFGKMPQEAEIMAAMRKAGVPAGEYVMPHCGKPADMKTPEYKEKLNAGPVGFISILPAGGFNMGSSLAQWFVYSLVIGVFTAYLAGRTLAPGADYLAVFRIAGTVAFMGYPVALWQNSIWSKRPWSTTLKFTFDGLVYGLFTGGVFGWLWP
jgi:hypothetical protein